jgi:predicted nucleotidyltransferase
METTMQLEEKIAGYFKANSSGVTAVYIFGSQASAKSTPSSDVDIAILFDKNDTGFVRAGIEDVLMRLPRVLKRDVHPVAMNLIGEVLLKQILKKGRCLLVNDARKLAEFKMRGLSRIAAFSYYHKKMQAGLIRRVLEAKPSG